MTDQDKQLLDQIRELLRLIQRDLDTLRKVVEEEYGQPKGSGGPDKGLVAALELYVEQANGLVGQLVETQTGDEDLGE